jgi:hypothetical protein
MLPKFKKTEIKTGTQIRKTEVPDAKLRFSFEFFDHTDAELCPPEFGTGYTQTLMQRLRDVSSWTIGKFCGRSDKTLRNHQHDWSTTSRPDGFAHLNEHYRALPGWQFCLTANAHGRVHGIIIDDTFYVIWLDQDHKLYP